MENDNKEVSINQVSDIKVKPKKKGLLLKFSLSFIVIIISAIAAVNYFIPGLIMTRDLGVRYSNADYKSALTKLQYFKDAIPSGSSSDDYNYIYGPTKDIDVEFSSSEITAFINSDRPDYFAFKNVQVRINEDSSIEMTGSANVDYFLNEIIGGELSRDEIVKNIPALGILPSSVNLYVNFSGSIVDNRTSLSVNSVAIQGINIPDQYIKSNEAIDTLTQGIDKFISKGKEKSGTNIEAITAEDSQLILKGSFPSSLTRQEK